MGSAESLETGSDWGGDADDFGPTSASFLSYHDSMTADWHVDVPLIEESFDEDLSIDWSASHHSESSEEARTDRGDISLKGLQPIPEEEEEERQQG